MGLEEAVALRMTPVADITDGGHQRTWSEPTYTGQTGPGSGLHTPGLAAAPRVLDFVHDGQGGGANGNVAGSESSWWCHQPEELQTPPPSGPMQGHSTQSSCDSNDEISPDHMDVVRGVSRSASSFGFEGEYHPEEESGQPVRPSGEMGEVAPDTMEVADEDSSSASGFGVEDSASALWRKAFYATVAVSKMKQMQQVIGNKHYEVLEKIVRLSYSCTIGTSCCAQMSANSQLGIRTFLCLPPSKRDLARLDPKSKYLSI